MSGYDIYKPFRNHLRKFELLESLDVIRAYIQYFQTKDPLPQYITSYSPLLLAHDKRQFGLHEWDLADLAKEVVLNCIEPVGERSMRNWPILADTVNRLNSVKDNFFREYRQQFQGDILLEMYRKTHQQFPWQRGYSHDDVTRNFKIFSHPPLETIFKNVIGLNVRDVYVLGLALIGNLHDKLAMNTDIDTSTLLVDDEAFPAFLNHFSSTVPILREMISRSQSYDQDYSYTFNPLRAFPLIRTTLNGKAVVIGPVSRFLFDRITDGIYYDLVGQKGVDHAYGSAFQRYVGDVVSTLTVGNNLCLLPEQKYYRKKGDEESSVDWIIQDSSADLFVECKSKRLRNDAKVKFISTEVLYEDFDVMASAIIQVYKTMNDALAGLYLHWKSRSSPIFPIIVTPGDWYPHGDRIHEMLIEKVKAGLSKAGLPHEFLDKYPYTVCGVDAFEKLMRVISKVGIQKVMSIKTSKECFMWLTVSVLTEFFSKELSEDRRFLFEEEWGKIHPEAARDD